ncbi:MAG TPA: RCC1 domain-containing protein [Myxococcaceae bacterium]|nr:RCC1 domain-containing protein [Myxococcaceae bacterium]
MMSFSWGANTGTAGPPTSSADTSTVSNALGVSASHSFTVTGLPTCASLAASVLAAGAYYSARLMQDGTVWAWGYNGYGGLGDGTTTYRAAPVQVTGF